MIVQISLIRNERILLENMLPIWKKYSDGFVFMVDRSTDDTVSFLNSVKEKYNILDILEHNPNDSKLIVETELRQQLFDKAREYTSNIICLDADEYLDGDMTKDELETLLNTNPNTTYFLQWLQYTSVNTIRIDGPWKNNLKDRIGSYTKPYSFTKAQNHSTHLPSTEKHIAIPQNALRVVHLQWLDKKYVAIKQYYWKVYDYVNNLVHKVDTVNKTAYDESVNNFVWEEEYTFDTLKISPYIIEKMAVENNYRLDYIKEKTKEHNIPNLGDWGYDITSINTTDIINPYKVSVITAIGPLNIYEKYIPRYIVNVREQHLYKQTEHIIVYSEWSEWFESLKDEPNFVFIKEQERKGVYNAWNIGIQAATTEYVTNWNIDDIRHPINTKIKYDLLVNNNYDLAYNYYTAVSDPEINFYNIKSTPHLAYPDHYEKHVFENCYAGPDPLWRKSLHNKVGYFDYENFNTIGDWEMWIRFAVNGAKFKLIPEVLCIYLDHNETVSQRQAEKATSEKSRLVEKYSEYIQKR